MVATQTRPHPAASAPLESAATSEKLLTAEEFYALSGGRKLELVNGKVVELMPPGGVHGDVAADLCSRLHPFVRQQRLGRVFVETGFLLRRNPDMVRSPDISYVEASRLPDGRVPSGFIEGAPTLAVEIVSPGDLWTEIEEKIAEYFEAGTRAVWVVEPRKQVVHVRTRDGKNTIFTRSDTLPGGEVLPDFELPLAQLFE